MVGASHSSTHLRFFLGSGGSSAANIASSNTFFRPFCEHKQKHRLNKGATQTHTRTGQIKNTLGWEEHKELKQKRNNR